MLFQMACVANGPVEQVAATIGANFVQAVRAIGAKCTFERTNEGAVHLRGQIGAALFAIGSHFQHIMIFLNRLP